MKQNKLSSFSSLSILAIHQKEKKTSHWHQQTTKHYFFIVLLKFYFILLMIFKLKFINGFWAYPSVSEAIRGVY